MWRYEVEAAVNSRVFNIVSVESCLVLIILLKLLLHIVSNRLETVHSDSSMYSTDARTASSQCSTDIHVIYFPVTVQCLQQVEKVVGDYLCLPV